MPSKRKRSAQRVKCPCCGTKFRPVLYRAETDKASTFMERTERWTYAMMYAKVLRADPCSYCGSREKVQVDHIEPLRRPVGPTGSIGNGGVSTEHINNVTAACARCNRDKNTDSLLDFLMRI